MKNAKNRISRAERKFIELKKIILNNPPYIYTFEVDLNKKECCTYAKGNESNIDEIKMEIGDLIHQIRITLDNAYWDCVSPFVNEIEHRSIQFPIGRSKSGYENNLKSRLAAKVSDDFFNKMKRIKAHPDEDGNKILCLINELDITDKHKFPNPIIDYTTVSTSQLKEQINNFPENINIDNMIISNCHRHICWSINNYQITKEFISIPPTTFLYEKELNINIGINIKDGLPLLETLHKMINEVKNTISILSE